MRANNILRLIGLLTVLQLSSSVQADTTFNYSYIFSSKDIIAGSFTGSVDGNLITNLSNITASFDGLPFNTDVSGRLYGFAYVTDANGSSATLNSSGDVLDGKTAWANGDAVASFDGTQNNFLFIDSVDPNGASFTNFFAIGNAFGGYSSSGSYGGTLLNEAFNSANWTVTEAIPTPVPGAVWLFGSGLSVWIGINKRRRLNSSI